MNNEDAKFMPVGAMVAYAGDAAAQRDDLAAAGWLICDGQEISQVDFKDLFDVIGLAFGAPDGGALLNLPDLRGLFMRGVSNDSDSDPDKNDRTVLHRGGNIGNTVGSYQEYATGKPKNPFAARFTGDVIGKSSLDGGCDVADAGRYKDGNGEGRTDGTGGDLETRPVNKYVYYLIKYKPLNDRLEPVVPPVGSVIPFAGTPNQALQQNWVHCAGSAQSVTGEFKDLYGAIGTANGTPQEGEFNLPDYRGYFLRGVSMDAEGRDPEASEREAAAPGGNAGNKNGSKQGDATAYPVSDDFVTVIPHLPDSSGDPAISGFAKDVFTWNSGTVQGVDVINEGGGDAETRPINTTVGYYIRFR